MKTKISLQKFISAASRKPAVAQKLLDALDYDMSSGYPNAISVLVDDVADDPKYHGITSEDLQDFLEEIDATE